MNNYNYVSITALGCYFLLFISLSASKKNKLIKSFMIILVAMILWTGGSYMMRSFVGPSIDFWYNISMLGLCISPYGFITFFSYFLFNRRNNKDLLWLFGFVILYIINVFTDLFLAPPEYLINKSGNMAFYYHCDIYTYLFFLLFILVVLKCLSLLIKGIKEGNKQIKSLKPILFGMSLLAIGNGVVMLGLFAGFPIDIVCGVINAFCIFYALYKRHLFHLNLLVSRRSSYVIAGMMAIVFFANFVGVYQDFLYDLFNDFDNKSFTLIVAVSFTVVTAIIYLGLKKFIDVIFVKEEIVQAECLKSFSKQVSHLLTVKEILELMGDVILKCIETKQVYICIQDESNNYPIKYSSSPLKKNNYIINQENPIVTRLKNNDEMIFYSEFKHTINYRSMWDSEKELFNSLDIEGIIPIKCDSLTGIILLSPKPRKSGYSYNEINLLSSLASISTIALINSRMYEKVYQEAISDELTGLLNRKYFYDELNKQFNNCQNRQLSLIMISIDDVRLYNQLYGNKKGDELLTSIAKMMKDYVNSQGFIGRLTGKEFGIVLPDFGVMEAKNLAENIRIQIMNLNKRKKEYSLKVVTASFGISTYPLGANNVKQLLDYCDLAMYQAKRNGKNRVALYNAGIVESSQGVPLLDTKEEKQSIYSEYAPTIYALTAAIDAKDHYTFTHSKNVAYYATKLAMNLGYDNELVEIINEAALLHDIGKIGISESILKKDTKLTDYEFSLMQSHVEASVNIIRHLPSLDYVIPIVLTHHERYDGRGYPRRIAGEDIPVGGRIMAIADSFDAMTSKRCYKEAFSIDYALNELTRNIGLQFDPVFVRKFIELVNCGIIEVRGNKIFENEDD